MKPTYKELKQVIDASMTMREASIKINIPFNTFKRYAIKFKLYKPNQGSKGVFGNWRSHPNSRKIPLDEILSGKHPTYVTSRLRRRLILENIFENKCSVCGINKWNNKPISLHLDHINGINNDHRLENLRIICPNCHSQTPTFGKTKRI